MYNVQGYLSDVAVKQVNGGTGRLKTTEFSGKVRAVHGTFVAAEAAAAGSVINLAVLPKGARLLPESKIYFAAGQNSSLAVTVGDSADSDRYATSVTVGAAAKTIALEANKLGSYVFPEEDVVKITTAGAALAVGKVIAFDLYYVTD